MRRIILTVILLMGGILLLSSFVQIVQAQSCGGGGYYIINGRNAACPSDRACGNECIYTNVYSESCYNIGGTCMGLMGNYQSCNFSICNKTTKKRTCAVSSSDPLGIGTGGGPCSKYPSCANGFLCDGTAVTGTRHQVVCGGGNINYVCQSNGNWGSQGTFCNLCGQDITNNTIGAYPGLSGNLGWTAVGNITRYRLRIDDGVDGWIVSGQCPNGWTGPDYCSDVYTNSFSWTAIAGHSYHWWVDACGANDFCTEADERDVTAPSAPISGDCSTPHNACSAGTSSDTADSSTQYLWDCVGSNGGSTASCSQNIPTPTPSPSPTPTPTPTPAVASYFKLKNTSFYSLGAVTNPFPAVRTTYDSDDDNSGYLLQGTGLGVAALRSGSTVGSVSQAPGISTRRWSFTTPVTPAFTPSSFISYARSHKTSSTANISSTQLSNGGMYYDADGGSMTDAMLPSSGNTALMSGGNVSIARNGASTSFNGTNKPFVLIVNGKLTIDPSLTQLNGVFIASSIDFGGGTPPYTTPLKIVGNLSLTTQAPTTDRARVDKSKASVFIVFDPTHYVNLLDKLSITKSKWTQVQ